MKTGRLNAEDQRKHELALAKMAVLIRMRPDLSYQQIAQQFKCSLSMVGTVVRKAGLLGTRPRGPRPKVTAVTPAQNFSTVR